jgi:hypothetical protein
VLGFDRFVQAPFGLPSRRLPALDLPQAFRVLAIPLVPTPWLVLLSTAFAQANARTRTSRARTTTVLSLIMTGTHGSLDLPRDSPGGTCYRSPRALITTGHSRAFASLYFKKKTDRKERTRQGRKLLEKGAAEGNDQENTRSATNPPGAYPTLTTGSLLLLGVTVMAAGRQPIHWQC